MCFMWPTLYCGMARCQACTCENDGGCEMPSTEASSRCTVETISDSGSETASGSVAPPTKLVSKTCPSGARLGKSEEFQTLPRIRNPDDRGTRNPKPTRGWRIALLG